MQAIGITYDWVLGNLHVLTARKYDLATRTQIDSISSKYRALSRSQEELRIDVSSAIGLFERKADIGPQEIARLERCLADLLILLIQPSLSISGSRILIKGPAFPKLIGRIGYRFPRSDVTIAFVTPDKHSRRDASPASEAMQWHGPYPAYDEDRITGAYLSSSANIRVDLFSQGLSRFPGGEVVNGHPVGAKAKIDAATPHIVAFSDQFLQPSLNVRQADLELHDPNVLVLKAARQDAATTTQADQGDLNRPRLRRINEALEVAIFDGVSSVSTKTEIGRKRFLMLRRFFDENDLGSFGERFDFLTYIEEQLVKARSKRNFVYELENLRIWFSQNERSKF